MGKKDPRVDAYIAKSAGFARPILQHLRELVHETCPGVEEEMKWSTPAFMYRGMFCSMAAFKQYCTFGFWKSELVLEGAGNNPRDQIGKLTSVSDLPPKRVLVGYLRKAMKLNDEGVRAPWIDKRKKRKPLAMPRELAAALGRNRKAKIAFEAFNPSSQRDYIEWITEAKTDATRERRLATAIEWIGEGKTRNWKYERK